MMPVYFIQAGENGPIKIGFAKDAQKRLTNLQSGNHKILRIISIRPGGRSAEQTLHMQFSMCRLEGEWFDPIPELLAVANQFPPPVPATAPAKTKLQSYLRREGLTATAFAAQIDRSISTVTRAAKGEVIPDLETMRAIQRETAGKVQPNDFYEGSA